MDLYAPSLSVITADDLGWPSELKVAEEPSNFDDLTSFFNPDRITPAWTTHKTSQQ